MPIIEIKTQKELSESEIIRLIQEDIFHQIHSRFNKLEIPTDGIIETKTGFRFELDHGDIQAIMISNGHIFFQQEDTIAKVITFEGDTFRIIDEEYHSAVVSEIASVLLEEFDHAEGQALYDKANLTDLTNIAFMFGEKHRWVTSETLYIDDADTDFNVILEADGHLIAIHAGFEVDGFSPFNNISRHCALPAKAARLVLNDFRNAYKGKGV
jgi:hypothetical protein